MKIDKFRMPKFAFEFKNLLNKVKRERYRTSDELDKIFANDVSVLPSAEKPSIYWKALARYATGTSHQKQQLPCQDYGDYKILNELIIGAVADGAGSAKHADIGSKLAVTTVLDYLAGCDRLLSLGQSLWTDCQQTSIEEEARQIFIEAIDRVSDAFQTHAIATGCNVDEFACTLLAFVATRDGLFAMQIGDGFIIVRSAEEEFQMLFPPDKGEFLNETTFLTSINAIAAMRVCVKLDKPDFICVSTDGLEKVAIRMSDWTPFIPFFEPLEEYIKTVSTPEQEDEYLIDFLNSDRLNARTDDDKTLLLCCYYDGSDS